MGRVKSLTSRPRARAHSRMNGLRLLRELFCVAFGISYNTFNRFLRLLKGCGLVGNQQYRHVNPHSPRLALPMPNRRGLPEDFAHPPPLGIAIHRALKKSLRRVDHQPHPPLLVWGRGVGKDHSPIGKRDGSPPLGENARRIPTQMQTPRGAVAIASRRGIHVATFYSFPPFASEIKRCRASVMLGLAMVGTGISTRRPICRAVPCVFFP